MNLENRSRNKAIAGAAIIVALFFLLFGCKPSRHYVKVATDTDVTTKEKNIIAPWVATHFPVRETFIPGKPDTVIEVVQDWETLGQLNGILDSLLMLPKDTLLKYLKEKCVPKREIVNIRTVDTIQVESGATIFNLQQRLAVCEGEVTLKQNQLDAAVESSEKFKNQRNTFIGILSLIVFAVGVIIAAKLRLRR